MISVTPGGAVPARCEVACTVTNHQPEIVACGKGCIMIQPVDLHRDLAGLPMLKERYGHPTDAESLKSFATLAAYCDGGISATHFSGSSGWERLPHRDEVVQILEEATRFDIIVDAVMQSLELSAGMLVVVPPGCWHCFTSETGVKVLTVTPKPTPHTHVDDPRTAVVEDEHPCTGMVLKPQRKERDDATIPDAIRYGGVCREDACRRAPHPPVWWARWRRRTAPHRLS
jgi:mannose-6-phosphate isomerase-like protein (cupin superfamily)